jgi:hypothetical protein
MKNKQESAGSRVQNQLDWPEVPPAMRPKKLPHHGLDKATIDALKNLGWDPQDVRLLPNITDGDRAEALKAWLEGIRYGTIIMDPKAAKWLELESRVYGLHAGKGVTGTKSSSLDGSLSDSDDNYVDIMLQFGNDKPWTTTADQKAENTKRKPGRTPKKYEEEPK